jgi:hypothetical protein
MERIITLRKEASALRALAERIDLAPIRDQLLDLAARCEVRAKSMQSLEAPPEEWRGGRMPADGPPAEPQREGI